MSFHNRVVYWSHTKFADKLRDLFGIPHLPLSATWEKWEEIKKNELKISLVGVKLINMLDVLQKIVYWPTDISKDIIYFISNVYHRSHILRTRVKFGQWGDLTTQIPDALMFAIIDFIEKECFWMNVAFVSDKDKEKLEPEVQRYITQSYIIRKLGGVKVSDSVRAKHAREWIDFQISDSPEKNTEPWEAIWAAYQFAKTRYFIFDPLEESGYNAENFEISFGSITSEKRKIYDIINKIEEEFKFNVEKHCVNIVKYRNYLWT